MEICNLVAVFFWDGGVSCFPSNILTEGNIFPGESSSKSPPLRPPPIRFHRRRHTQSADDTNVLQQVALWAAFQTLFQRLRCDAAAPGISQCRPPVVAALWRRAAWAVERRRPRGLGRLSPPSTLLPALGDAADESLETRLLSCEMEMRLRRGRKMGSPVSFIWIRTEFLIFFFSIWILEQIVELMNVQTNFLWCVPSLFNLQLKFGKKVARLWTAKTKRKHVKTV